MKHRTFFGGLAVAMLAIAIAVAPDIAAAAVVVATHLAGIDPSAAFLLAAGPLAVTRGYEAKGEGDDDVPGLAEIKTLITAQGTAWEEFKRTNDERLAKLAKGESITDHEAKLAKINESLTEQGAALKEMALKAGRQGLGLGTGDNKEQQAELKSFNATVKAHAMEKGRSVVELNDASYVAFKDGINAYIRRGDQHMSEAERKAINVGTDPQGGYLVGHDMESGIDRVVRRYSIMRQRARVITIGNATYKKLIKVGGHSGGTRGGETSAPVEGVSSNWAEIEFKPGTYLSEQRITSEALEDAVQDVEGDLLEEIGIEFAEMEGQDFIDGAGINGARGLLSYTMIANAAYAWGKVGFTVTGAAATFAAANPSDALIDLQHALKRQYRANATWSMNDATLGAIRKFKDGNGLYLWAPSALMQGAVGQLLGHPVDTDDFMPDLGANTFPIAFADFNRAYYVVDRKGVSILRDPFTAVPYVKFIGRRRVGGGIANFEAVKVLKCSA